MIIKKLAHFRTTEEPIWIWFNLAVRTYFV